MTSRVPQKRACQKKIFIEAFAIILQHFRFQVISSEASVKKWLMALLGFFRLFLKLVRFPAKALKRNYVLCLMC